MFLVVPIFLTLETGVFRSNEFIFNSSGLASKLPVPLSLFACYAGIALLGNFRRARLALAVIAMFATLMMIAALVTASGNAAEEKARLMAFLQYALPMFGLVLGMVYDGPHDNECLIEKAMLAVITVLMPAQLLASWMQGHMFLTPYLYVFSAYQHLQYVPVVIACSFMISLFGLWDSGRWRHLIIMVAPIFGIYVVASGSMLAAGFSLAGCAAFTLFRMRSGKFKERYRTDWKLPGLVFGLVLGLGVLYNSWTIWGSTFSGVGGRVGAGPAGMYTQKLVGTTLPANFQSRQDIWTFHLNGILGDPTSFLFGHSTQPDRSVWPSAHNYYLDVAYNFGVLATLVIVGLVVFTIIRLYQHRRLVLASSTMTGLALVVLFLILPDSLIKVSLRQPYPGIFAFFLWRLLLARIDLLQTADAESRRQIEESANEAPSLSAGNRTGS